MKITVNTIAIFSPDGKRVLFCKRAKDPYQGLYNFVGGHVEPGETGSDAAYRELHEETGISRAQVDLVHIIDYTYYAIDTRLEVWFGRLKTEVTVYGEENELCWLGRDCNFFDTAVFAGDGNIGHIMRLIEQMQ